MADTLKMKRALSLKKLKDSNKRLTDAATGKRVRMANKYYDEVIAFFKEFEDVHIQYALKSGESMEDPDMETIFYEASDVVDVANTTIEATRSTCNRSRGEAESRRA